VKKIAHEMLEDFKLVISWSQWGKKEQMTFLLNEKKLTCNMHGEDDKTCYPEIFDSKNHLRNINVDGKEMMGN
jgi:Fe-S cluster biosynthesis and repair protein YggX